MSDYEDYLYDNYPHEETHPDRLATIAALFNLRPAPPARCRVLELGCGPGCGLVAMAESLPDSSFVGVDLTAGHIDIARADARALGLKNVEFHAMDIMDVGESFGVFDYIISHGVYSWIPPEVQAKMLAITRSQLAPNGVAYISYNTLPGWGIRGLIRDALIREAGTEGRAEWRILRARELLSLLSLAPRELSYGNAWLKNELEMLERLSDSYILAEHLTKNNRPVYFKDFIDDAGAAGLRYLADALFYTMVPERFGPAVAEKISAMSRTIIDSEQYMDLLDMRYFRRTLLCHREIDVDRSLSHRRLRGLYISSPLRALSFTPDVRSDAAEIFQACGRTEVSTSNPLLKAALIVLDKTYPRGIVFEELCVEARRLLSEDPLAAPTPGEAPLDEDMERLGGNLLGLYLNNQIELNVRPLGCALTPGAHPRTLGLARYQARRGDDSSTTLRHRNVPTDSLDRALLSRMDGTVTLAELIDGVAADIEAGKVVIQVDDVPQSDREVIESVASQKLERFARAGLLVG